MPGFFVCNSVVEIILNDKYPENLISESLYNTNGYTVLRNTLNKFVGKKTPSRERMNPTDYWITRSKKLSSFLDEYEEKGYYNLPAGVSNKLINDLKWLYKNGTVIEKNMTLTVLSAAKLYSGACK